MFNLNPTGGSLAPRDGGPADDAAEKTIWLMSLNCAVARNLAARFSLSIFPTSFLASSKM